MATRPDVDEAPFDGTIGPGARLADDAGVSSGPVAVGAQVRVLAGRHRGATAEVVRLETLPTPSGRGARMALIRRPRAGESWEFVTDLVAL